MRGRFLIVLPLLLGACGGPRVREGWVQYPDAGIQIRLPAGWRASRIFGVRHPIISTEEDYGIEPNLFAVSRPEPRPETALRAFLGEFREADPELKVLETASLRVETLRARKGLPLFQVHYAVPAESGTVILTGTCAAPTRDRYEPAFDRMVESIP